MTVRILKLKLKKLWTIIRTEIRVRSTHPQGKEKATRPFGQITKFLKNEGVKGKQGPMF